MRGVLVGQQLLICEVNRVFNGFGLHKQVKFFFKFHYSKIGFTIFWNLKFPGANENYSSKYYMAYLVTCLELNAVDVDHRTI